MEDQISKFEKKIYSQNGEDGITLMLLDTIGIKNRYYVEFGVEMGHECNTRILREKLNFNGLMMDGKYENLSINLHKEFITAENINELFEKYSVPNEFDVLSIDLDKNDIFIWKNLDEKYKPNIVIIEYCAFFLPPLSIANKYFFDKNWQGSPLSGASLCALNKIAKLKGYSLIYCETTGVNCFFIKNDSLHILKEKFPNYPFGNVNLIFQIKNDINSYSFFEPDGSRTEWIEI